MGDRKPSQFLRHLRSLDSDVPDSLLRFIVASWLQSNVQVSLAGMPGIELDTVALCADRIIEAIFPSTLTSIESPMDWELSRKVENHIRKDWSDKDIIYL
jgi:hypothetical protein